MEATRIMAAINFLQTSPTTKITAPTTPWISKKPSLFALRVPVSVPRTKSHSTLLSRCSTRPDTETDNQTDQNPILQSNSNPSQLNSSEAISSSLSETSPPPSSLRGLVLDLGPTSSWDSFEIGSPVVKRFLSDEEERWYMWYYGNSGENPDMDSVGLAISSNGIHWDRGNGPVKSSSDVGLVMNCSQDWWAFDTLSIRPGEVVIMSSTKVRASNAVYWLYYTGYNAEKVNLCDDGDDSSRLNLNNPERFCNLGVEDGSMRKKILKSLPGLAMSQDGRHWARIEGEHHSGALFDVGSDKDWDSSFISSPKVVFHGNGDLRMFYHSFDVENGGFGIGIARSRDGIKWVKLGKIMGGGTRGTFDEFGVKNPCVVRNKKDGKYVMVYEGVGADGKTSIGLALSNDGLKDWRRFQDEAVLKPQDGWDNEGVGSPCLIQMDGDGDDWRLYYRGIGNGRRAGIGLAVSQGIDLSCFRRWTGFHL